LGIGREEASNLGFDGWIGVFQVNEIQKGILRRMEGSAYAKQWGHNVHSPGLYVDLGEDGAGRELP
jgi:hypothetical protein